jgi:protein-disulfide isomerase
MALKDRLDDAILSTPPENAKRRATLEAVKAAAGGLSDAEIQSAVATLIAEREQKAGSFAAAGQTELAKAERAECDAMRAVLRAGAPQPQAAPKKAAAPKAAAAPEPPPEEHKPLFTRNQVILGLVVVVLAFVAGYFVFHRSGSTSGAANNTAIVVQPEDRTLGNPNASVVLLEYAAPTCPHCARLNETLIPKIKQEYVDTGKVLYVFRAIPLNPVDGAVEAIARKCLPADKYFQFLDLMFRNQPKWDPDGYKIDDVGGAVKQMARIMGVSPDDADRCMTDQKELDRINQVGAEAYAKYKVDHTPTLIINGVTVDDADMSWPQLKAKLDSLLSKK